MNRTHTSQPFLWRGCIKEGLMNFPPLSIASLSQRTSNHTYDCTLHIVPCNRRKKEKQKIIHNFYVIYIWLYVSVFSHSIVPVLLRVKWSQLMVVATGNIFTSPMLHATATISHTFISICNSIAYMIRWTFSIEHPVNIDERIYRASAYSIALCVFRIYSHQPPSWLTSRLFEREEAWFFGLIFQYE